MNTLPSLWILVAEVLNPGMGSGLAYKPQPERQVCGSRVALSISGGPFPPCNVAASPGEKLLPSP